jgi:hypothetical protein
VNLRVPYTPEQLEFLRLGYLQLRIPELTLAFNAAFGTEKTRAAIKTALTKNGFTCGRHGGYLKGTSLLFSQEQVDFIRENYPLLRRHELTAALNARFGTSYTFRQVITFAKTHDIKSGRTGRIEKGSVPPNKGQRRPGWSVGRMTETQFKKGRPAHEARNYLPIGSTRITRDGILERKVTDDPSLFPTRRWISVQRLVWEAAHGPISPGMKIVFKPGLKTNIESEITIDRLEMVSPAENMKRNSVHNYPAPIPELVQLRGALTRQINHRRKHGKQ